MFVVHLYTNYLEIPRIETIIANCYHIAIHASFDEKAGKSNQQTKVLKQNAFRIDQSP